MNQIEIANSNKKATFFPILRTHHTIDELLDHYSFFIEKYMALFPGISFDEADRMYNTIYIEIQPGGVRQWKL